MAGLQLALSCPFVDFALRNASMTWILCGWVTVKGVPHSPVLTFSLLFVVKEALRETDLLLYEKASLLYV